MARSHVGQRLAAVPARRSRAVSHNRITMQLASVPIGTSPARERAAGSRLHARRAGAGLPRRLRAQPPPRGRACPRLRDDAPERRRAPPALPARRLHEAGRALALIEGYRKARSGARRRPRHQPAPARARPADHARLRPEARRPDRQARRRRSSSGSATPGAQIRAMQAARAAGRAPTTPSSSSSRTSRMRSPTPSTPWSTRSAQAGTAFVDALAMS